MKSTDSKPPQKRNAGVLCFYGELNPFSNFHSVEFELDGEIYRNSEQYIQQQKAIMFEDKVAEAKIMVRFHSPTVQA